MREILFRGFHPFEDGKEKIFYNNKWVKGEWVYGYYINKSNHACFMNELKITHYILCDKYMDFNLGGIMDYRIIPETVGQYTGLEDMFDRKIFEGDIVKYKNKNMQVVFNRGSFYIEIGGWLDKPIADIRIFPFEVIGNIHSNPELLGVE